MKTRVLTASVSDALVSKVDAMASRLDRSRGWVVEQALTAWVELEEDRHRMTLEALAEVDAGLGIPHEAIVAWIDSLATDSPLPPPVG